MQRAIRRRTFLSAAAGGLLTAPAFGSEFVQGRSQDPIRFAEPSVKPFDTWRPGHLEEFLAVLPSERMLSLQQSLKLVGEHAGIESLSGDKRDIEKVLRHASWVSSNVLQYPFRSAALDYHALVEWVARKTSVDPHLISSSTTFELERAIQLQIFKQLWTELSHEQRAELLEALDPAGKLGGRAAIAALGAGSAIAALAATTAFSGFAFYTSMSTSIATMAGFFGVTLPFGVYMGASTLVAFLSGPAGWAIAAGAVAVGAAKAGAASVQKSVAFICQVHELKVAALRAAGTSDRKLFSQLHNKVWWHWDADEGAWYRWDEKDGVYYYLNETTQNRYHYVKWGDHHWDPKNRVYYVWRQGEWLWWDEVSSAYRRYACL